MANRKMPNHENRLGAIRVSFWSNVNLDGSRWHTKALGRSHGDALDRWQVAQHHQPQNLSRLVRADFTATDWIEQGSIRPEATCGVNEFVSVGEREMGRRSL